MSLLYKLYKSLLKTLRLLCLQQALLGNGSQQWEFLYFHTYILAGWQLAYDSLMTSQLQPTSKSVSELLYNRQFIANQFILVPSLLRLTTRVFSSRYLAKIISSSSTTLPFRHHVMVSILSCVL